MRKTFLLTIIVAAAVLSGCKSQTSEPSALDVIMTRTSILANGSTCKAADTCSCHDYIQSRRFTGLALAARQNSSCNDNGK